MKHISNNYYCLSLNNKASTNRELYKDPQWSLYPPIIFILTMQQILSM